MATNLHIDTEKLDQLVQAGKFRTKRDAVNTAIDEALRYRKQLKILDLFGTVDYVEGYDHKALRRKRQEKNADSGRHNRMVSRAS